MPLLAANRQVLNTRFPEVAAELVPWSNVAVVAQAAEPSLPKGFAEVAQKERTLSVLPGLPSPATAGRLQASAPPAALFWSVEKSAAELATKLSNHDYSAWLRDPRVFLSIGPPSAMALRRVNREFAWIDEARAVRLPDEADPQSPEWEPLIRVALARMLQRWQGIKSSLRLQPVQFENTIENLPSFLRSPAIESLAGAFNNTTLILVGAGPSLDDALPFLREAAPRALIATGNTSFRALASKGLAPHLTVTVDPFPSTDLGYQGQNLGDTHLVAPVFAYPAVHRRFERRLFGLWDHSALLARLRRAAGLAVAPAIIGDDTVSATILNLAVFMGCRQVIFVGQDFAIADDGRTHAADTFYTDIGGNRQNDDSLHRLKGNTRAEVLVPTRHLYYLRTIERQTAAYSPIRFFNTSHLGAVIDKAPFLSYADAAKMLATEPGRNFTAELAAIHEAPPSVPNRNAMLAELARTNASMSEALRHALTAALAAELALHDPTKKNRQRFEQAATTFERWRDTHREEQDILFAGRTNLEIFEAEKRRISFPKSKDLPLREASEIAWAFAEGCAFLSQQLSTTNTLFSSDAALRLPQGLRPDDAPARKN